MLPVGSWRMPAMRALLFFAGTFCALAAPVAGTLEVLIRDYRYEPPQLKIRIGDAVQWVNQEKRVSHSILFLGPGGFESERIFPGESWRRVFSQPGSYPYTCGPHPEMKGLIEVE